MTHKDPFPSQVRTGANGEEIFIVSKDDGSILVTMTGNDLFHLDLANLFVTAHNSHDALLEALLTFPHKQDGRITPSATRAAVNDWYCNKAKPAIAKAKS